MKKEKLEDYAKGGTVFDAWIAFEAYWQYETSRQQSAWVKVWRIQALTQTSKGWTVKYSVKEAQVTQPINPMLALELLDNNLIGYTLPNAWFIVNPARVEEIVLIEE